MKYFAIKGVHMSSCLESILVETEACVKQFVKIIAGFSKLRTVTLYASSEVINRRDIQTCSSISQLACYVTGTQLLLQLEHTFEKYT